MKAVGVRELKSRLREYLRLVRNGEEILVTDRARAGLPNRPDLYLALGPAAPAGSASRLLDEERGDR